MRLSKRFTLAAALAALLPAAASGQIMRFNTNVGSFNMTLNPTNDPRLQPLVDNIVAYIGLGRYSYTAINRAADGGPGTADDFVLQMGGFSAFPPQVDLWLNAVRPVETLNPVIVDADNDGIPDFTGMSNTRGTVSMALSNFPNSQTSNPNSGTSQFFVNLGNNSNLDGPFIPFARIDDLTTIERIMALQNEDLTGPGDSSPFDDVPLIDGDRIVILKSVHVLQAPSTFSFVGPVAKALEQIQEDNAAAAAAALLSGDASEAEALMASDEIAALAAVGGGAVAAQAAPEPAAASLAGLAAAMLLAARRRRSR